jgi:hypothetical protein
MTEGDQARGWSRRFPEDVVSLHVAMDGGCVIDAELALWRYRLLPGEVLVVNRGVAGASGRPRTPPRPACCLPVFTSRRRSGIQCSRRSRR